MKIAKGVRDVYDEVRGNYDRLSKEVCSKLEPEIRQRNWFFTHRLKEQESFALKIETGRVSDPRCMEDFFACTIIVPTMTQVSIAESFLKSMYCVKTRRPKTDDSTHKKSSDFIFDDLRLYLEFGTSKAGRNNDLKELVFEVQIKTILQHAWGIASHDLIYKTDNVSWPKERIAFQVKAMLEHAEIAIAEAERLADSPALSKKDKDTASTVEIIDVIRDIWDSDCLPRDIKRLSDSMFRVLKACKIEPNELETILVEERSRLGILPSNLSPYAFLIQALANNPRIDFKKSIVNTRNRVKILVHSDMDLPGWMHTPHEGIIRV